MDLLVREETRLISPAPLRLRSALAGTIVLLASTMVLVSFYLPGWAYPLWNTGAALVLIAMSLGVGLSPRELGLRISRRTLTVAGLGVLGVTAVYGLAMAIPATRVAFHDNRAVGLTLGGVLWTMLIRVPFGTALLEEVAFRGVLPALFGADGVEWRWRPVLLASAVFGLWHFFPSLHLATHNQAVHELLGPVGVVVAPVVAMLAAGASGVFLCYWRHLGRGILAPFLLHVSTNAGGYLLAWLYMH